MKIGVAVFSAVVTYLLVLIIARCYSWQLGIQDRQFRYENAISMWRADPVIGFTNERNFSDYCFGTVHVSTNEHGFRGEQSIPKAKPAGTTRIIGLGDSVMWGTSVEDSESFLGRLRTKLKDDSRDVEVINAGVVGYSTLQESLLLEHFLLDFTPDFVLVNFCENDMLPTEDPHRQVRSVHVNYMNRFLEDRSGQLTEAEQVATRELIWVFESPAPVHMTMAQTSMQCRQMAIRLFLEVPIQRMAELAKANNAELIYLFIPPRQDNVAYRQLAETVKRVLDANEVSYLDLASALSDDQPVTSEGYFEAEQPSGWLQAFGEHLLPDVRAIKTVWQINRIHQEQNYIDFVHPSKKGNEIIASQIHQYLSSEANVASGVE